jgi:hypothetical protein
LANHKATGKKSKHGPELAQRCRAAVLGAFRVFEKNSGKLISEVLAEELQNNPIKFMELASKFIPKEIDAEISHTLKAEEMTVEDLDERIARLTAGEEKKTSSAAKSTEIH